MRYIILLTIVCLLGCLVVTGCDRDRDRDRDRRHDQWSGPAIR
jgi:hypothetical protein